MRDIRAAKPHGVATCAMNCGAHSARTGVVIKGYALRGSMLTGPRVGHGCRKTSGRHRVYRCRSGERCAYREYSHLVRSLPAIDFVRLLAIVFVAICLVAAGAHLAELPNKIALAPGE